MKNLEETFNKVSEESTPANFFIWLFGAIERGEASAAKKIIGDNLDNLELKWPQSKPLLEVIAGVGKMNDVYGKYYIDLLQDQIRRREEEPNTEKMINNLQAEVNNIKGLLGEE